MKLYHATTAERAETIMREGFCDHATVNTRLFNREIRYPAGVWFGSVPAIDDELFDGVGLFDFDAEVQHFIMIDVPVPAMRGRTQTVPDDAWPGKQYWAAAEFWNTYPRTRLSLDEAILVRLALYRGGRTQKLKGWLADRLQASYGQAFASRVARLVQL